MYEVSHLPLLICGLTLEPVELMLTRINQPVLGCLRHPKEEGATCVCLFQATVQGRSTLLTKADTPYLFLLQSRSLTRPGRVKMSKICSVLSNGNRSRA